MADINADTAGEATSLIDMVPLSECRILTLLSPLVVAAAVGAPTAVGSAAAVVAAAVGAAVVAAPSVGALVGAVVVRRLIRSGG